MRMTLGGVLAVAAFALGACANDDLTLQASAEAAAKAERAVDTLCHTLASAEWARTKIGILKSLIADAGSLPASPSFSFAITNELRSVNGALLRCRQLAGDTLTNEQTIAAAYSALGQSLAGIEKRYSSDCAGAAFAGDFGHADAEFMVAESRRDPKALAPIVDEVRMLGERVKGCRAVARTERGSAAACTRAALDVLDANRQQSAVDPLGTDILRSAIAAEDHACAY